MRGVARVAAKIKVAPRMTMGRWQAAASILVVRRVPMACSMLWPDMKRAEALGRRKVTRRRAPSIIDLLLPPSANPMHAGPNQTDDEKGRVCL